MIRKLSLILLFVSLAYLNTQAQQKDNLIPYIPYDSISLETHPVIDVRVVVHVIKRTDAEPKNVTEDSLQYIYKQLKWINDMYKYMKEPSRLAKDGNKYYISDSRIHFNLDTILFHTDSSDWDRVRTVVATSNYLPWKIDSITSNNELVIKGNWSTVINRNSDSLAVNDGKGTVVHRVGLRVENNITYVKIKENIVYSDDLKITYFKEDYRNCSQDIWKKYTNSDKTAIHIFYTGSSRLDNAFGCGPSPFFLNVSNLLLGGEYAAAQLSAHELGHCLGLRHTNYPQFDDLPGDDKFGWIPCNNSNTSNNIMGYNTCRNYLSPKQIGFIHKRYTADSMFIKTTMANVYDTSFSIEIWDHTIWNKEMVVRGDIIIRKRQTLTINGNLHMANGATIYLEKRAKLIINGVNVTNYFGGKWNLAIIRRFERKKHKSPRLEKNKGKVELLEGGGLFNYSN